MARSSVFCTERSNKQVDFQSPRKATIQKLPLATQTKQTAYDLRSKS